MWLLHTIRFKGGVKLCTGMRHNRPGITSFVTNNRLRDSTWNAHWQKLPKHANVVVGCSIRNLHSIGKSIICNQWHCVAGHLFITVFKAVPDFKSFLDNCLSLAICSDLAQNLWEVLMSRNGQFFVPKKLSGRNDKFKKNILVELTPLICIVVSFSTINVTTFMDAATFSRKLCSCWMGRNFVNAPKPPSWQNLEPT